MCETIWSSAVVLLLCVVSVVVATTSGPAETLEVRVLKSTEQLDHDLCRRLAGEADPALPNQHGVWPLIYPDAEAYRQNETLVAIDDGLVVGRLILEARYQPCCELVNMCVRRDYQNRGTATALVREAMARARGMGFKYMFTQEYLEDAQAHGIQLKAGFLPATRGQMQRMVRLLDAPAVSHFLTDHPHASFTSEAAPQLGERCWRLAWQDDGNCVSMYLHGGSCQGDSEGLQPVFSGFDLTDGELSVSARLDANRTEAARGDTVELTLLVRAQKPFSGVVRAILLPGTEILDGASPVPVDLTAAEEVSVVLPIQFCDTLDHLASDGFLSYRSVPLTLELCWDRGSVILSAPVIVR